VTSPRGIAGPERCRARQRTALLQTAVSGRDNSSRKEDHRQQSWPTSIADSHSASCVCSDRIQQPLPPRYAKQYPGNNTLVSIRW